MRAWIALFVVVAACGDEASAWLAVATPPAPIAGDSQFLAALFPDRAPGFLLRSEYPPALAFAPEADLFAVDLPCAPSDYALTPGQGQLWVPQPTQVRRWTGAGGGWAQARFPDQLSVGLLTPAACAPSTVAPLVTWRAPAGLEVRALIAADAERLTLALQSADGRTRVVTTDARTLATFDGGLVFPVIPAAGRSPSGALARLEPGPEPDRAELQVYDLTPGGVALRSSVAVRPDAAAAACLEVAEGPGGEIVVWSGREVTVVSEAGVTVTSLAERTGPCCGPHGGRLQVGGDGTVYVLTGRDRLLTGLLGASAPTAEALPDLLRLDDPRAAPCGLRAALSDGGLVVSDGLRAYRRQGPNDWSSLPHPSLASGPIGPVVRVGGAAVALPSAAQPSGGRLMASARCPAGLGAYADAALVAALPSERDTVVLWQDPAQTLVAARITEPSDEPYRRCWDRPSVPLALANL